MKVICFGDSNTYSYDPRSWLGGRYGVDGRWVDIVADEAGWTAQIIQHEIDHCEGIII